MNNFSKKQLIAGIVLIILMIAIPLSVYLAQKTQIFKSKAANAPIVEALEIKDSDDNTIVCDSSTNPPTCPVSTTDITIKLVNPNALIPNTTKQ